MGTALGGSPAGRVARLPLHRRLAPIVATVLAMLASGFAAIPARAAPIAAPIAAPTAAPTASSTATPAAPANPAAPTANPTAKPNSKYQLSRTYPGDPLHIPVLMYRHRHTKLSGAVSWDRNVAAFNFVRNGIEMVIVGPSITGNYRAGAKPDAPIDIYRKDPTTGEWQLSDIDGNPLKVNGKLVDWRTDPTPTDRWNFQADPHPAIQQYKTSGSHSERTLSLYLNHKLGGLHTTTTMGLSELIPCLTPGHACREILRAQLFPNLVDMKFLIDLPNQKQAYKLGGVASGPDVLQEFQQLWENVGSGTGPDVAPKMGQRWNFSTPGSPPPQGPAASALGSPAGPQAGQKTDLGGIDFSTLELRYLKEGTGGKLQYAFDAKAKPGHARIGDGQTAAAQSSDAFFVWLSMPESSYWVNLNPGEPNRIVDEKLGTTDVGRILLEADFRMKSVIGRLIHPDTSLGKQVWGELSTSPSCLNMRQWIVPAPATVYEQDGGLHIVDAPLQVKSESEHNRRGVEAPCHTPDTAMENKFRTMVLPKVEQAVNESPDFAELRRVYLSRVAAGWYRQRHSRDGNLSTMIDSGNVSAWPALKSWSPRKVYDQYVDAYRKKEFNVTKQEVRGNTVYSRTYTYGGVDFSKVQLNKASPAAFQRDNPDRAGTVQRSIQQASTDQRGKVWLGAVSQPLPPFDFDRPAPPTSNPLFYSLAALPVGAWLVTGAWLWYRRRAVR